MTYRSGLLAVRLQEAGERATVLARDLSTGEIVRFDADRVFVGCGAIGTSRLVLGSLEVFGTPAVVQESEQFVLPFLSAHPVPDPQREATFTLNQFNMAVALDDQGRDLSHLHFYTFDQTFLLALPTLLQRERLAGVRRELLRHLSVALGYVPSWLSRTFSLVAEPPAAQNELPSTQAHPFWRANASTQPLYAKGTSTPRCRWEHVGLLARRPSSNICRSWQELPLRWHFPTPQAGDRTLHK